MGGLIIMYKIGYTQGAFDMFHIGHLNLIKNAKAQCEYLIVGVNTDELIHDYKDKDTVIPLEERMAIIESLKYVDEVIPAYELDKKAIVIDKKCDVIFVGSDWERSERWQKTKEEMKKRGVDVVFLPYTRETNSTLLREKLLSR